MYKHYRLLAVKRLAPSTSKSRKAISGRLNGMGVSMSYSLIYSRINSIVLSKIGLLSYIKSDR